MKTVKYINPAGGTWTVAAQRIPAQSKDEMEMDAVSYLLCNTTTTALGKVCLAHNMAPIL